MRRGLDAQCPHGNNKSIETLKIRQKREKAGKANKFFNKVGR